MENMHGRENAPSLEEIEKAETFLTDIVENFDYEGLKHVARDYIERCGGDLKHVENIARGAIAIVVDRNNPERKGARPNMGFISNFSMNAVRWAKELKNAPQEFVRLSVQKTIIHEFIHVVSGETFVKSGTEYKGRNIPRTGYKQKRFLTGDFEIFNEGITDRIAFEWLSKYLETSGESAGKKHIPALAQQVIDSPGKVSIGHYFVSGIVKHIAGSTHTDEHQIWQALVQGNFSNGLSKELARELNSVFGLFFTNKLGKAEYASEFHRIEAVWKYVPRPHREEVLANLIPENASEKRTGF